MIWARKKLWSRSPFPSKQGRKISSKYFSIEPEKERWNLCTWICLDSQLIYVGLLHRFLCLKLALKLPGLSFILLYFSDLLAITRRFLHWCVLRTYLLDVIIKISTYGRKQPTTSGSEKHHIRIKTS